MRILLAGGGTAGHVEPALNLADAVVARFPSAEVVMLGTDHGLEARLAPERGYPLELVPAVPLPRRVNRDLAALPTRLRTSVKAVRSVMARRRTDVVVGFGGYVAMPAYLAARRRVPLVVHEANARAGLANRVGARFTPYVAQAVDGALPGATTMGIPLRASIVNCDRAAQRAVARAAFGLDPERPVLFVFGGSLGARRINDAVLAAVPGLIASGCAVLHAIGSSNADQLADLRVSNPGIEASSYYRPVPYIDRMDLAYAAADLALCRAGAMTCAELAAVGLPAVYVPLPIGNGEQRFNAEPTVIAGGGEFLPDSELSATRVEQTAIRLLRDQAVRERMSAAAASRGISDGAERLLDMVVDALGGHADQGGTR
ncbi:MAG: UDP-N-acetylglucosamine--N-acetylmuramyl-(pentapeptide) pyrophosphoryl-undecaprenol N-acetylglucosamine transferase [Actinomycetes bacterium]